MSKKWININENCKTVEHRIDWQRSIELLEIYGLRESSAKSLLGYDFVVADGEFYVPMGFESILASDKYGYGYVNVVVEVVGSKVRLPIENKHGITIRELANYLNEIEWENSSGEPFEVWIMGKDSTVSNLCVGISPLNRGEDGFDLMLEIKK